MAGVLASPGERDRRLRLLTVDTVLFRRLYALVFIERWIGTVRRECLDRILIVNRRHLERVLPAYIRHYNEHRPHRSLNQRPPIEEPPPGSETDVDFDHVRRRDLLGGLIHEYKIAA